MPFELYFSKKTKKENGLIKPFSFFVFLLKYNSNGILFYSLNLVISIFLRIEDTIFFDEYTCQSVATQLFQ